jgi:hypothetical protein
MTLHVISLFDHSAIMLEPWAEAGYECWALDIEHRKGMEVDERGIHLIHHDLSVPWLFPGDRSDIAAVFAFPPCDHLAVSGARWFKGKGLRALGSSIELFATAAEFCEWSHAPYLIENPVSTISTYWRKPDYHFHPYWFSGYMAKDNYTKHTCLWTGGGFVMPKELLDKQLGEPDDRIHKAPPSKQRKSFRSATPGGFARAVFEANRGRKVQ